MKNILLFLALSLLLLLVMFMAISFGSVKITLKDIISGMIIPDSISKAYRIILWEIRIPRVILGILVGGALAVSGCVFQAILRNPLADSYTLGISGGAAFGVVFGTVIGSITGNSSYPFLIFPLLSLCGALFAIFLVYIISSKLGFTVSNLILTGIVVNFLFSSVVLLIFSIIKKDEVHNFVLWLMGDLSSADIKLIKPFSVIISGCVFIIILFGRELNLLSLGEERASQLGVNKEFVKRILFFLASVITGLSVSLSGIVGFVGLIIPHVGRKLFGVNHLILIPATMLLGCIFLILCDTIARTVLLPFELPVGVITGIIGGIFFISLLFNSKKWGI